MVKFLVIFNVCLAMLLMPIAQAYTTSFDVPQTTDNEKMEMTHCQEMSDRGCGKIVDCEAKGMHCVDSINLAILYSPSPLLGKIKDRTLASQIDNYHHLWPLNILRPPRYS